MLFLNGTTRTLRERKRVGFLGIGAYRCSVIRRNETGGEYGTGNLEAFILGHGTLAAQEFNRGLVNELHTFKGGGDFRDDVFLLSIKIR